MTVQFMSLLYFLSMIALPATASPLRSRIVARDQATWPDATSTTDFVTPLV